MLARRVDQRADGAAVVAGAVLVAWIVVEYAYIRAFSPFQAVYLAVGLGFIAIGRSAKARR